MPIHLSRVNLIQTLRRRLERDSFPRLQMSFLVIMTAAVGFISSYTLLQIGLTEMWLRYLVAIAIAYLAFLLLLWLWLRTRAEDYLDFTNIPDIVPSPGSGRDAVEEFTGQGGSFGGGGASGTFEARMPPLPLQDSVAPASEGGVMGEAVEAASNADELAIPLIVLLLLVSLLLSSLFVIYSAPVLFAEVLLDGVLAAGLYHRLQRIESHHWLETAIRRTLWPFVLTAITIALAGWAMAQYVPGAHSLGDVLLQIKNAG